MELKKKLNSEIKYDGNLNIAVGQSRTTKTWKNKTITWSELIEILKNPVETFETPEEYKAFPKAKRDDIKDVGGIVAGWLKEGKRKQGYVQQRSMVVLDADSTTLDLWDDTRLLCDFAVAISTTHSHTSKNPRYRMFIPLKRPVTAEEYEPLARKIAEMLGMDNFDDTTYQAERLMHKPSHSKGSEYFADYQDLPWVDPDEVLSQYEDWRDVSYWPESSRGHSIRERQSKKAGDPLTKKGIVGAFCRTYNITSAIETFLPDIYGPTRHEDRWTFLGGSTNGGLIAYDDKFAYSHHGTDPVGQKLANAFDLVRIHKFGDLDDDVKPDTPITRYPSTIAMSDFARKDAQVNSLISNEMAQEAAEDFADIEEVDDLADLMEKLEKDDKFQIKASAINLELIMNNDPNLKDRFCIDDFAHRWIITGDLPWRKFDPVKKHNWWADMDDAGLRVYLEKVYGIVSRSKIEDALLVAMSKRAIHPVREYLNSLSWDGHPRVETLMRDYLGAEDTYYNRVVIRKYLAACVARVFVPGIKFDYMIMPLGDQGLGKSTLPAKLAGKWFSDSLEGVTGKDSYESLQGVWIMEVGEMSATSRASIEATKHFISKAEDIFRMSYGRRSSAFPRQCCFWGSTNEEEALRDPTGNRRYWPVEVGRQEPKFSVWDMSEETRGQIWAEALQIWKRGETLYLNKEDELLAREQQEKHRQTSDLEGQIEEFLGIPITEDWYELSIFDRKTYITSDADVLTKGEYSGKEPREKISAIEIWCEMLNGPRQGMHPAKRNEIVANLDRLQGWKRYENNAGRMNFGKDYGKQTAWMKDSSAE